MKQFIINIFSNQKSGTKIAAFLILGIIGLLLHDLLPIFFAAFVIGFLIYSMADYMHRISIYFINNAISNRSVKHILLKVLNTNFFVTLIYIILLGAIFFVIYKIIPQVVGELKEIPERIPFIRDYLNDYIFQLEEFTKINQRLENQLNTLINEQNVNVIHRIINTLKNVGSVIVKVLLAIILSYICVVERREISSYFERLNKGIYLNIYTEIKNIFKKIFKWFSLIFKAQLIISLTNTVLTAIGLLIIGYIYHGHFPYLLTLSCIVFLLGFIPVAGTLISSIPILIIGYMFGGPKVVLLCIGLIVIIHALETYVLNPRIVGSYVKLPMPITFIILIISEHLLGIKGLLIGIPIFFIIMELIVDIGNGGNATVEIQENKSIK